MTRTRTTSTKQTAKKTTTKTATKKTTARKPPAKTTTPPVDLRAGLPTRHRQWMTDTQGYATLAARTAGIPTLYIRDWRDHGNGTATRPLDNGLLHYDHNTRRLTWQTECPMGAIHSYPLTSPSTATWARIHAARCTTPHTDLSTIPPLTQAELAELGILHTPDRPNLPGDEPITETIPIPKPELRTLADTLTRSDNTTTDTQPIPALETDQETPKEHPTHE